MMKMLKAMLEFMREVDDMSEHARTGRKPVRGEPAAHKRTERR